MISSATPYWSHGNHYCRDTKFEDDDDEITLVLNKIIFSQISEIETSGSNKVSTPTIKRHANKNLWWMSQPITNIHQAISGKIDLTIQKQLYPNANRKPCTLCLYNDNWVYHKESSLQHTKKKVYAGHSNNFTCATIQPWNSDFWLRLNLTLQWYIFYNLHEIYFGIYTLGHLKNAGNAKFYTKGCTWYTIQSTSLHYERTEQNTLLHSILFFIIFFLTKYYKFLLPLSVKINSPLQLFNMQCTWHNNIALLVKGYSIQQFAFHIFLQ
jgi:hypothetical protein